MKIYDGKNAILGRLAAVVAKEALLGEEVRVVNCEQVVISGKPENTLARERQRRLRKGNPLKSAVIPRLPDRMVRRTIRGMLPWKHARGKAAFKRAMCHVGVPPEFAGQELLVVKSASAASLPTLQFITVGEVCNHLRGKPRK